MDPRRRRDPDGLREEASERVVREQALMPFVFSLLLFFGLVLRDRNSGFLRGEEETMRYRERKNKKGGCGAQL